MLTMSYLVFSPPPNERTGIRGFVYQRGPGVFSRKVWCGHNHAGCEVEQPLTGQRAAKHALAELIFAVFSSSLHAHSLPRAQLPLSTRPLLAHALKLRLAPAYHPFSNLLGITARRKVI